MSNYNKIRKSLEISILAGGIALGSILGCSNSRNNNIVTINTGNPDYTETNTNAPDGTFDCKVKHAYSSSNEIPGYTISLTVKDDDNSTSTDTAKSYIAP